MAHASAVDTVLRAHATEIRELCNLSTIPTLAAPIDPLTFHRDFVARNRPAILTGCVEDWAALRWTHEVLRERAGECQCHVACTPDGRADAISSVASTGEQTFAQPHEAFMSFGTFLDTVESPLDDDSGQRLRPVHYASAQNSSFLREFGVLVADAAASLDWADAAFGVDKPVAVNLWMGEDVAVSAVHQDLYENIYVVVKGSKVFELLPPQQAPFLANRKVRAATWCEVDEGHEGSVCGLRLQVDDPEEWVSWSMMDELHSLDPIEITVTAGQILYLPSLWWHRVSQRGDSEGTTAAINYWYDAPLGVTFGQKGLLEALSSLRDTWKVEDNVEDTDDERRELVRLREENAVMKAQLCASVAGPFTAAGRICP